MKNLLNIITHSGFNKNLYTGSICLVVLLPIALMVDTDIQNINEYRHAIAGWFMVCYAMILIASWFCRDLNHD